MIKQFSSFVIVSTLAGCATSPQVTDRPLEVTPPAKWVSAAESEAPMDQPSIGWLSTFNDPKLEAIIAEAMAHNYSLRTWATLIETANANAIITGANRYPQLGAGLNSSRRQTRTPAKKFSNSHSLNLNLSWEIDLWGRLRDQSAAAIADTEAAQEDYNAARLSIAGLCAKAWFRVTTAKAQLNLAQETLRIFESNAAFIQNRFESGTSSSLDLRLTLAQAASARATLAQRQQQYHENIRTLEVLLGRYPANALKESANLPSLKNSVPAGLPSDLLTRRPDILAAERRLAAADRRILESKKKLLPSISLTGSAGTASSDLSDLLDDNFSVWNIAGGLFQPLFQGKRLAAGVERRKSIAEQAFLSYAQTTLNAFQEVEDALAAEQYLAQREVALLESTTHSKSAERLAQDEYAAGVSDIFTVLVSQRRSIDAQNLYLSIRELRLNNRVNLYLALGGDFDQPYSSL